MNFLLCNTDVSIAFKNVCGQYDIEQFSLFEVEKINRRFTSLEVKINRNKEIHFKVKCPLCGEYHHYNYNIGEFVKRDMIIGGCEALGVPLYYIGEKENVEKRIKRYREISEELYAMI